MPDRIDDPNFRPLLALAGQGGLIAIAVTMMITLVIAGAVLANLSSQNAQHAVVIKQTLQTYYAAQAGIQEAIANRMLPRSNYLNFNNQPDPNSPGFKFSDKAYFSRSGRISQDPASTASANVIAEYRYMVLGGDAARKPDKSYFSTSETYGTGLPKLLSTDTIPTDSPFIVISQGVTCTGRGRSSMPLPGKFQNGILPQCASDSRKDEIYIVAKINMLQGKTGTGAPIPDQVVSQRIFKDKNDIVLPEAALVPGKGWVAANQKIDFEDVWSYTNGTDASLTPLTLRKIVFYDFANNKIEKNCEVYTNDNVNCDGSVTDEITNVPPNAAIRLYFNGAFDYRTISPRQLTTAKPEMDTKLSDCKTASICNIRVWDDVSKKYFNQNTIIPLFPGGTQVILLPPMVALTGNRPHRLDVDTKDMRSANNQQGSHNYRIKFRTK